MLLKIKLSTPEKPRPHFVTFQNVTKYNQKDGWYMIWQSNGDVTRLHKSIILEVEAI